MLATAASTVVVALAGCATGDGGTETDGTDPATATTVDSTTTTDRTTTEPDPATAEPTTTEESTTAEPTTTEEQTTAEPTTTEQATTTEPTTTAEPTATATTRTVTVAPTGDLRFDPESLTVPVGSTVEFEWDASGHNVVVGDQPAGGGWNGTEGGSGTTYNSGHTHSYTFETAGTYEYYCSPHRSFGMVGTIVVE